MIHTSDTIEMKTLYTFNKIERLDIPVIRNIAKHVRGQAKNAWLRADVGRLPTGDQRYGFELVTAIQKGTGVIPDADSSLWIAKRVLDGAIDAGVLPNDSPRFIAGVHVHSASYVKLDRTVAVAYVGVLTTPVSRKVTIYV